MPTTWSQGHEPPRCLAHPGSQETVDVRSLRSALFVALRPANLQAWHELVGDTYDLPDLEPGDAVGLDALALILDFVGDHLDEAADEAAQIAGTAPGLALSQFKAPSTVAAEFVAFVRAARRWLDEARRHGGPAMIRQEPATIFDPTVLHDVEMRMS